MFVSFFKLMCFSGSHSKEEADRIMGLELVDAEGDALAIPDNGTCIFIL